MVAILFIVLFILQLISFYLIILLNSKVARFKDLEIRQDQVIREMDDSIGAYLMEMKEENDRLIKELSLVQQVPQSASIIENAVVTNQQPQASVIPETEKGLESILFKERVSEQLELPQKTFIPKNFAANAYNKQKAPSEQVLNQVSPAEQVKKEEAYPHLSPFEREVVMLHKEGKSIEEIAKKTQKGKTEIELLIKFHS